MTNMKIQLLTRRHIINIRFKDPSKTKIKRGKVIPHKPQFILEN